MKFVKLLAGFLLLLLAGTGTAMAAEFIRPTPEDKGVVSVPPSTTHRNLYVAGGNVTVESNTTGDLVVAGGMVTLTADVEQDLMAAGGNVFITGEVGGDARLAGGNISVQKPVGGDLLVGGGNVLITEAATVDGDLVSCSGNLKLDAPVKGNVRARGGVVNINGKISGNVYVRTEGDLIFGPKAEVVGAIYYTGPRPATIKEGAKIAKVEFTEIAEREHGKKFSACWR